MIIVTSGAVAVGSSHFNHLDRSLRVEEKQTVGAIGQVQLMRAYEQSLKRHSFGVWQILLTREDSAPLNPVVVRHLAPWRPYSCSHCEIIDDVGHETQRSDRLF
ncbi:hypothetical protein [Mesorhizobium sp. M0965]|uniref:hypothetical protein n=1 Tax=Mesorhizobium sp. M0965 TaxID=2957036 RepID=UPI00333720FD